MTVWLFVATGCSLCEYKSGSNQGKLLTHLQKAGGCTLDERWYYRHLHLLGSELQEKCNNFRGKKQKNKTEYKHACKDDEHATYRRQGE